MVATGIGAIDLAGREKPDLIVLSTRLADMPAVELVRILKSAPGTNNIPIAAITPLASDEQPLLAAGSDICMVEPIKVRDFLRSVDAILASRRPRRRHASRTPPLPTAGMQTRWTAQKKAAVVIAIRTGTLSRQQAYDQYSLSEEELAEWQDAFDLNGVVGLHVKRTNPSRSKGS
jgi:DNA-binding response OmpR family regulator